MEAACLAFISECFLQALQPLQLSTAMEIFHNHPPFILPYVIFIYDFSVFLLYFILANGIWLRLRMDWI